MASESLSINRVITRPYSKLNRLCAEASARGGVLKTFAAVAKAIDLTPGRVTQMFGWSQEAPGIVVKPEMVGLVVAAFKVDGVPVPFAVTVAAQRRSFVVADVDATSDGRAGDAPTDNKNVILNQFIYRRCGKDDSGRAVIAQATMTRCSENGDPLP